MRLPFLLITQPDGREMSPDINDIFEARLVQGLLDRVVLFPLPLARLALDRAPGDVIFVRHQAEAA